MFKLLIRANFAHTFIEIPSLVSKMIYCALILTASLPTSCIVVGVLLIVITIVALLVCALKWREATALKKEVIELRDTMRMMRYEEANLSRMLHTASKQPTTIPEEFATEESELYMEEKTIEEFVEETEDVIEEKVEEPTVEESTDKEISNKESVAIEESETAESKEETVLMENIKEEVPNEVLIENVSEIEGTIQEPTEAVAIAEEDVVEEAITEMSVEENTTEEHSAINVEEYVAPKPRKQAINERRPAIPTDLFAAWFEENDNVEPKEPETPTIADKTVVAEPVISKPEAETHSQTPTTPIIEEVIPNKDSESKKETISTLTEEENTNVVEPSELSKEDERFRRKLERIVNARMRNPNLNIDVIASQFGMGRTNFYRKVRELMGMSPNDYLRKCRMERAAELLQSSDQNIGEICGMVGIPDAQYFSRVFKSYFGVPPSSYREQ